MKASGKMSVERFEKEFEKEFGVRIEIKKGNRLADNSARLASLRPKDYSGPKSTNFEVSGRMHVGNVKAKLEELFGVTADLYSGRRIAPDDITLAALRRGDVSFDSNGKNDNKETSNESNAQSFFNRLDEIINSDEPLADKIRSVSELGREQIDKNQWSLLEQESQNAHTLYHEYSNGYIERLKVLYDHAESFEELKLLFDEFRPMDRYDKGYDEEMLEEVVQKLNEVDVPEELSLEDLYCDYLGHTNEEYYKVDPMYLSQYPRIILERYDTDEILFLFEEGNLNIIEACNDQQRDEFYEILMQEVGQEEFDENFAHFFEDEEEENYDEY